MQREEESNILVAIRVRPLNQKELSNMDSDIVRVEDNLIVSLHSIIRSLDNPRPHRNGI